MSEEQKDQRAPTKLLRGGKRARHNAPCFDLRGELYRISGVDLTRIDSINVLVAQTVISEVGVDCQKHNLSTH